MLNLLINPYKVGPPVTGGDFYGRSELLAKAYQSLQQSNVLLLQGQRRIGKTSFLKQLAAYVEQVPELPNSVRLVPVLFDIQRYVQDSLPRFQMHLAEAIARSLPVPVPKLPEWEADPALFRDEWLPRVVEQLGSRALMILVDEFDNFEGQASPQAMQTLIPFLGQLVSGEDRLKWVFAFGRLAGKLPIQYDPIISTSIQLRLSFLSPNEARELLEKPVEGILTYEAGAIDRIYQLTSGQPHLTQAIGSEVFQRVVEQERETATAEDVDSVVPSTLETYGSAIASIVKVPAIEERVLVAVVQLTQDKKNATLKDIVSLFVENSVQINSDELINALSGLIEWELLKGNKARVRIAVELVRVWLVDNVLAKLNKQEEVIGLDYHLAQSRHEFAEKARHAGRYDLAIKNYQEALEAVPNSIESLRGLAEIHRLKNDLDNQVKIIKNLYLHDRSVFNELVETVTKYANKLEKSERFVSAVQEYEYLGKIQNSSRWRQESTRVLVKLILALQADIESVEKVLQPLLNLQLDSGEHNELVKILIEFLYADYLEVKALQSRMDKILREVEKILDSNITISHFRRKVKYKNENKIIDLDFRKLIDSFKVRNSIICNRVELLDAVQRKDWEPIISWFDDLEQSGVVLTANDKEQLRIFAYKSFEKKAFNFLVYLNIGVISLYLIKSNYFTGASIVLTLFGTILCNVFLEKLATSYIERRRNGKIHDHE